MAREAISARIDGEEPGLPDDVLDVHLASCAACQGWQQRAHDVTRRARLGGPSLNRDLSPQVLAAFPPAAAGLRRLLVPAGRTGRRGHCPARDHRAAADLGA